MKGQGNPSFAESSNVERWEWHPYAVPYMKPAEPRTAGSRPIRTTAVDFFWFAFDAKYETSQREQQAW